jgi:Holliday junction DNA helicase RuvA
MLGWLRGTVIVRNPAAGLVIVETQGIGWELHVSIQTLAGVPAEGQPVSLHVHTNVREDAIQLFGFADAWEKQLFRMLTSVPKVGPKNAIAVLGGFPVRELVECIAARESAKLVKIPGIGGKTAEQIVLTLHDKMPVLMELMRIAGGGKAPIQTELPAEPEEFGIEARDVLVSLGWKLKAVEKALREVGEELGDEGRSGNLDAIVRATLAKLMER